MLRDVAVATNFETKIAITDFVWTIGLATRLLVMEGVWVVGQQKCRYCRYPATKGRCHGKHFCFLYNALHIGATHRILVNRSCAAAMRPYYLISTSYWSVLVFCQLNSGYDSEPRILNVCLLRYTLSSIYSTFLSARAVPRSVAFLSNSTLTLVQSCSCLLHNFCIGKRWQTVFICQKTFTTII